MLWLQITLTFRDTASTVAEVRADGLHDAGETVSLDAGEQFLFDPRNEPWPPIGKRRVQLNKRSAGTNFGVRFSTGGDAANAD
jgi:hypothetical protein